MTDTDPPGDSPDPVPLRSSDLPLLYVLATIHVLVLLTLPAAAWFIARFLRALPAERRPGYLLPALVLLAVAVEYGLYRRFRKLWRRIRGLDRF